MQFWVYFSWPNVVSVIVYSKFNMACIFHWYLNCNNNNTNNLITVIMITMVMMMMMMMTFPTNKHFPTSTGGSIWHQEDNLTLLSWRWSREGRNFHSAISHWAFSKLDKISTSKLQAKINCLIEVNKSSWFWYYNSESDTEAATSSLICIILHIILSLFQLSYC